MQVVKFNFDDDPFKEDSSVVFERILVRTLTIILSLLAVLIIAFSVFFFVTGKAEPGKGLRTAEISGSKLESGSAAFSEFGQLRAITYPEENAANGSPVIITPWLSYPANDKAFYEELVQKKMKIRSIITTYFTSRTKSELLQIDEADIKTELLNTINAELVLSKIEGVFFEEYMFLD